MEINVALVAVLTPVVMGIVQVAKSAGLSSRWGGIAAILIGAILGISAGLYAGDVYMSGIAGLVAGLTAAGAYSGVRAASSGSAP